MMDRDLACAGHVMLFPATMPCSAVHAFTANWGEMWTPVARNNNRDIKSMIKEASL